MNYLRYCYTGNMNDNFLLFTDDQALPQLMPPLKENGFVIISCGSLQWDRSGVHALPLEHRDSMNPLDDDVPLLLAQCPSLAMSPRQLSAVS